MSNELIWIAFLFIFGTAIGSFLNVVIARLPTGESVVTPRSHCVSCSRTISWFDNIPVISWIILRGKCRHCHSTISVRYLFVELITGFSFVAVSLSLSSQKLLPAQLFSVVILTAFLVFLSLSIALAAIDAQHGVLPNVLIMVVIISGFVLAASSLLLGLWRENALRMLVCGALSLGGYLVIKAIIPRGFGWGDVKLAAALGMFLGWVGWGAFIIGTLAAFAWGTLFAFVLMALKRARWSGTIYFGPWMVTGAFTGIFCGEYLWNAYMATLEFLVS